MAGPDSTRSPAFQFYPADFLGSSKVQRMSMAERGIYITLLSHCWLDGSLSADLDTLAAIVHVKPMAFTRLWGRVLGECFVARGSARGSGLVNPRLERERTKQADYRSKQAINGAKGGRPRLNPKEPKPFSGLTQTKPKKRSSSSSSSSTSVSNKSAPESSRSTAVIRGAASRFLSTKNPYEEPYEAPAQKERRLQREAEWAAEDAAKKGASVK